MNLCRACHQDFGSTSAFDAHRVGKHEYLLTEGLDKDPPREDGRRCLDIEELEARDWHQDKRGAWRRPLSEEAAVRIRETRRAA